MLDSGEAGAGRKKRRRRSKRRRSRKYAEECQSSHQSVLPSSPPRACLHACWPPGCELRWMLPRERKTRQAIRTDPKELPTNSHNIPLLRFRQKSQLPQ